MSDEPTDINAIGNHPLVSAVFRDAFAVDDSLDDSTPLAYTPTYVRTPDEYEFYVLRVSTRVAGLLHVCQQLDHTRLYLSNCRITPAMKKAGITRPDYLVFHIENYVIRTHMLYERILQLLNAVFHLLNDDGECTHDVIIGNLKVKRTGLPTVMRALKKLLRKYAPVRNQVIHHASYMDDAIRTLGIIHHRLLGNPSLQQEDPEFPFNRQRFVNIRANRIVRVKAQEYASFNAKVFSRLLPILDQLQEHYETEKEQLRLVTGHEDTSQ